MILKSILICDDHDLIRKGVHDFFKGYVGHEFNIREESDGLQCLESFKMKRSDIVFTDVSMPGINGIELTQRIRDIDKDTIVILFTMHKSPAIIQSAKAVGANGVFFKDSPFEELEAFLRKVFNSNPNHLYVHGEKELTEKNYSLIKMIENLTSTEKKVLRLIKEGKSSEAIAELLFVTEKSVNNYRNRISRKLDLDIKSGSLLKWITLNKEIIDLMY